MISVSAKVYPNFSAIIFPRVIPPAPNCLEIVITAIKASHQLVKTQIGLIWVCSLFIPDKLENA
jgi:hypothetical protein